MMPLEGELVGKSLEERRSRDEYRELAAKLRAQGYLSEGNLVDAIADDENKHSSVLMTLVGSIEGKKGVDEAGRREGERPFPMTYGDWVSLAEDIKTKYPDDPVMRASVNHQLHQIMRETEEVPGEGEKRVRAAQEARRWMTNLAGELGIK